MPPAEVASNMYKYDEDRIGATIAAAGAELEAAMPAGAHGPAGAMDMLSHAHPQTSATTTMHCYIR